MLTIDAPSLVVAMRKSIAALLEGGEPTAPRGLPTVEIRPAVIVISDPRQRIVTWPGREVNPCFAAAETLWILSGSDAAWIFEYNRALRRYADGGVLKGAYGPRLRNWNGVKDQLAWVAGVLREDRSSRRAVIQIFDPASADVSHRDVPCTISFRFFIRNECLSMHTLMRANDVWRGMPYDIFCFTTIQEVLAAELGVELGDYVHMVDSLHLYDSDAARAREAMRSEPYDDPRLTTHFAIGVGLDRLDEELRRALDGDPSATAFAEHAALLTIYRSLRHGGSASEEDVARLSPASRASLELWKQRH